MCSQSAVMIAPRSGTPAYVSLLSASQHAGNKVAQAVLDNIVLDVCTCHLSGVGVSPVQELRHGGRNLKLDL